MEKHKVLACYGMLILTLGLILSLGLASATVSANTLVGGKIYNSNDNNEVVTGADVIVVCGGVPLHTISLSDGTYAITFNGNCGGADKVQVSVSKGNLEDSDVADINEKEGNYVAVSNLFMKSKVTVTVRRGGSGGFFLCGNTVCDSGETHETCASDCPLVQEPLVAPLNDDSGNSGNSGNNQPNTETQTVQNTSNVPGLTGAVVGEAGESNHTWLLIIGILIILGILMAIISLIRGNMYRKKMGYN
jgi:hypothetical protein